jgi:uncharacterized protein YjbI with pentapeptide repeats
MDAQKLTQILTDHREWVTSNGVRGTRAYLSGANLSEAYLSGANLSEADLSEANLSGANLSGAGLSEANLYGANLSGANLSEAYLSGANLSEAYLSGANLSGANLSGAYLSEAKNIPERARLLSQIVPEEGAFRGFKKLADGYIAVLDVPESAQRSNATGRKCRVSEAVVTRIYHPDHPEEDIATGKSQNDINFIYAVGQTVRPTSAFDENRWNECGAGIHLFITRAEAEEY